jgi:hypothetical protein
MPAPSRVVVVDGETFEVTAGSEGVYFSWASGANPGYGFTSSWSGDVPPTDEQIRPMIDSFLSQIDPRTGYISEV